MSYQKHYAVIGAEEYGEPLVDLSDVFVDWTTFISNNCGVKPIIFIDKLHHF